MNIHKTAVKYSAVIVIMGMALLGEGKKQNFPTIPLSVNIYDTEFIRILDPLRSHHDFPAPARANIVSDRKTEHRPVEYRYGGSPAVKESINWKYVGVYVEKGESFYAFYDKSTEKSEDSGRFISVWVRFIGMKQVDSICEAHQDTIVSLLREEVKSRDVPFDTSFKSIGTSKAEIVANRFHPKVRFMAHDVLDCTTQQIQTESLIVYNNLGRVQYIGPPPMNGWTKILPNSFNDLMMKRICGKCK